MKKWKVRLSPVENNELEPISRNVEHEYIMISIYDALTYVSMDEEFSLEDIMEGVFQLPYEEIPYFSKEVTIKALLNMQNIIDEYQKNMPTWKFDRLNQVERAILLMSFSSFKLVGDIDKRVVINVAVKLAKKYLDKTDYKFVNALLDNTL